MRYEQFFDYLQEPIFSYYGHIHKKTIFFFFIIILRGRLTETCRQTTLER